MPLSVFFVSVLILEFFEFFGVNATKVQWCGRKFDHEVILKSKFVTTYRKLCKNIYCNILQYAIEFLQIYCILQYAINGILLHCIFIAIGLWFIGKGLITYALLEQTICMLQYEVFFVFYSHGYYFFPRTYVQLSKTQQNHYFSITTHT